MASLLTGENPIVSSYPNFNSSFLMQEYRPQTVIEHHEGERLEGTDAFEHGTLLKLNQENSARFNFNNVAMFKLFESVHTFWLFSFMMFYHHLIRDNPLLNGDRTSSLRDCLYNSMLQKHF